MNNHLVYLFVCAVFFISINEAPADQNQDAALPIHMVWAEPAENEYAIFFSAKNAAGWLAPLKVSANKYLNVTPATTIDSTGTIWVVWSVADGTEISLHYRKFKNNDPGRETKIETGLNSNTSPTLLVDGHDTVWLAWSGNDGQEDEIYVSRWRNGTFEAPVQITDNSVPDIFPVLSMKGGRDQPRIDWLQACDSGNCAYYSLWENSAWGTHIPVESDRKFAAIDSLSTLFIKNNKIPAFVKKPQSISIYIEGEPIQSLPLRLM